MAPHADASMLGWPRSGTAAGIYFLAVMAASQASASEASPLGLWARGDGKALVMIAPCDKSFCATNTWIKPGTPDEKVGDKLILTVTPSGPSTWAGEAFDPQRQTRFKIEIEAQEKSMTTRGCVFAGLLCKDMGWTRIQNATN